MFSYKLYLEISFCSREGIVVVGDLITWHNRRSILLVADVFGIRISNYSMFLGGVRFWRGESTFPMCIYLLCIIMSFNAYSNCDIDFCSYCYCMPVIYLVIQSYSSFIACVLAIVHDLWYKIYLFVNFIYYMYMFVENQALQSLCFYILDVDLERQIRCHQVPP